MYKGTRVTLSNLSAALSSPLIAWIFIKIVSQYDSFPTFDGTRTQLEEDHGLGGVIISLAPATVLAGMALVWLIVWTLTGLRRNSTLEQA